MLRFHIDLFLLTIVCCLMGFSLALIWSTNPNYLTSQLVFFVIGFIFYFLFSKIDSNLLKSLSIILYFFSVFLLAATLLSGEVRGASRWIEFLGIRIQPSEVVKPFIIISYAYFISEYKIAKIIDYFKLFILSILPIVIIFFQPDLGNVIIYTIFLVSMIFANNLNLKVAVVILSVLVLATPLFWHTLRDYQKQRIITFTNPELDPEGAGYNAIQSMISIGSGGIFGRGLGRGTQSHLRFLPENHTDFIFASLTEELGLFGASILLIFYSLLFIKIFKVALLTQEKFGYLVILGIFIQLFSQVFINIAMNTGLVPITGITLPLLSAGGSSILGTFIVLGIVSGLEKKHRSDPLVIK